MAVGRDPAWKSAVGEGKDVKWPVGNGRPRELRRRRGRSSRRAGAVGYVEQAYALENGFTYAAIKNSAGTYVLPTIPNTSAAFLRDQGPGRTSGSRRSTRRIPQAYPIVSQTFLVAYKDPCKDGGASSVDRRGAEEVLHLRVRGRAADARRGLQPAAVRAAAVVAGRQGQHAAGDDGLQRVADLVGESVGGSKRHTPLTGGRSASRAVVGRASSRSGPAVGADARSPR